MDLHGQYLVVLGPTWDLHGPTWTVPGRFWAVLKRVPGRSAQALESPKRPLEHKGGLISFSDFEISTSENLICLADFKAPTDRLAIDWRSIVDPSPINRLGRPRVDLRLL